MRSKEKGVWGQLQLDVTLVVLRTTMVLKPIRDFPRIS